jgi:hypothetical protein
MRKKQIVLHSVIVLFAMAGCSSNKGNEQGQATALAETATETASVPVSRKYELKSGVIHFDVTMAGIKGKKIVYFDDYGSKERTEEYAEDGVLNNYRFSDGKTRYHVDVPSKTAYIADQNGSLGWEMEFVRWERITRLSGYEKQYKKASNITVAGKDCEAFEYGSANTFAGWKGLTLYHEQKPHVLIKAVKLDEDVAVEASKFAVPEGYEIKERMF